MSKKKKTHEYCSENAEVSGGNFLISHEEDKTKQREGGKRKDEKKDRKKREVEKSKSTNKDVEVKN